MFTHFDVRNRLASIEGIFTNYWCIEYTICEILEDCGYTFIFRHIPVQLGRCHYAALRAYIANKEYAFTVNIGARTEGAGYRGYIDITI